MPQSEATRSLCGSDDVNGNRLAEAFGKGICLHGDGGASDLQDSILGLILSNIKSNLHVSLTMLGLIGSTRHNCLTVIFELIADSGFVLDPRTSTSATKCFEVVYRVCELRSTTALTSKQLRLIGNLCRGGSFWRAQAVRYLGMRGPSTQSIFHEVSNSYRFGRGDDMDVSRRDNDVLHSISWLLKGLANELHYLMLSRKSNQLQSLLDCLLASQPLLLMTLMDIPLGQAKNDFIEKRLHVGAPSSDILRDSSRPMPGPVEVCAGYEVIDVERLLSMLQRSSDQSSASVVREWATTWNGFVERVCA